MNINLNYKLFCLLISVFIIVSAAIGCSYQSVNHLNRKPWVLNKAQTLEMKYLTFAYHCEQNPTYLVVKGKSFLKKEELPDWVNWTKGLWLGAYLSDQNGRVLAKQIKMYPSQEIKFAKGYEFNFILRPKDMGSPGPIFINFGYRLELTVDQYTADKQNLTDKNTINDKIFFASESSLTKF